MAVERSSLVVNYLDYWFQVAVEQLIVAEYPDYWFQMAVEKPNNYSNCRISGLGSKWL